MSHDGIERNLFIHAMT